MEPRLPSFFAIRALAVCSSLAVLVLWMGGGSAFDAIRLLLGVLPVGANDEGLFRLLLTRCVATFALVTGALFLGMAFALAITVLVSRLGGTTRRLIGWIGSALSGIPPMAWAIGTILLLVRYLHLPVETLFPYAPPETLDHWGMKSGRTFWAWIVPAAALGAPVFGTALFVLTHRLSALLKGPLIGPLRSRGVGRSSVVFRHLVPELRSEIRRMVRPLAAMTLTFAIPVEEAFRFDGWGNFTANALRHHHPYQIATAVYLSGFMLAAWYVFASWRERKGSRPQSVFTPPDEESRSTFLAGCGGVLMLALVSWPFWSNAKEVWHVSHAPALREVLRSFGVAFTAAALIVLSGPLMMPRNKWLQHSRGGTAITLAAAPLLLCWLALVSAMQNPWAPIPGLIMVAALPSAATFRQNFRALYLGDFATASIMLGRSPQQIWWQHLFPNILPSVLNRMFRSVATLLLWCSLLGYFGLDTWFGTNSSWGEQMQQNSEIILDTPLPVLAPAVWLALWSLSFRLLSRAFSPETPRPRTSPFDP